MKKPVAIVMALSNRTRLQEQALRTLRENTEYPYKLFKKDGMEDGEMKTVNSLVRSIDYDWEYLVRADDDLFFNKGWLKRMMWHYKRQEPELAILGGCRYPRHSIIGEPKSLRGGVYITDVQAGNHWLLSWAVWNKFGPFYEDFVPGQAEDRRFCQKLQNAGLLVGCLKDPTFVVHCGIRGTGGRGRSPEVEKQLQEWADAVGAITE